MVTNLLPDMPSVGDPCNIYSADGSGDLSPVARTARPMIYVPNSLNDSVTEIDPTTYKVVRNFAVGALPQHVVPSWDLKTLWVTNDQGNSLTPIDPVTGAPGTPVPVDDPYNMYFTPDGAYAIVVAEAMQRLDFRDPHTMALVHSLSVPCHGVDHMDFSANGRYLIASCEFSGKLLKVDVASESVVGTLALGAGAEPQDVKLSPDGKVFYVADLTADGVWEVDGDTFKMIGFIPTGKGAHGLYVSQRRQGPLCLESWDGHGLGGLLRPPTGGRHLGASVRSPGRTPVGEATTPVPTWAESRPTARCSGCRVGMTPTSTRSTPRRGQELARIPVGYGPHGLCVWPQPGRYSLGHTGILR